MFKPAFSSAQAVDSYRQQLKKRYSSERERVLNYNAALARAYLLFGKLQQAEEALDEYLEYESRPAIDVTRLQADLLLAKGQHADALEIYREVSSSQPNNRDCHSARALCCAEIAATAPPAEASALIVEGLRCVQTCGSTEAQVRLFQVLRDRQAELGTLLYGDTVNAAIQRVLTSALDQTVLPAVLDLLSDARQLHRFVKQIPWFALSEQQRQSINRELSTPADDAVVSIEQVLLHTFSTSLNLQHAPSPSLEGVLEKFGQELSPEEQRSCRNVYKAVVAARAALQADALDIQRAKASVSLLCAALSFQQGLSRVDKSTLQWLLHRAGVLLVSLLLAFPSEDLLAHDGDEDGDHPAWLAPVRRASEGSTVGALTDVHRRHFAFYMPSFAESIRVVRQQVYSLPAPLVDLSRSSQLLGKQVLLRQGPSAELELVLEVAQWWFQEGRLREWIGLMFPALRPRFVARTMSRRPEPSASDVEAFIMLLLVHRYIVASAYPSQFGCKLEAGDEGFVGKAALCQLTGLYEPSPCQRDFWRAICAEYGQHHSTQIMPTARSKNVDTWLLQLRGQIDLGSTTLATELAQSVYHVLWRMFKDMSAYHGVDRLFECEWYERKGHTSQRFLASPFLGDDVSVEDVELLLPSSNCVDARQAYDILYRHIRRTYRSSPGATPTAESLQFDMDDFEGSPRPTQRTSASPSRDSPPKFEPQFEEIKAPSKRPVSQRQQRMMKRMKFSPAMISPPATGGFPKFSFDTPTMPTISFSATPIAPALGASVPSFGPSATLLKAFSAQPASFSATPTKQTAADELEGSDHDTLSDDGSTHASDKQESPPLSDQSGEVSVSSEHAEGISCASSEVEESDAADASTPAQAEKLEEALDSEEDDEEQSQTGDVEEKVPEAKDLREHGEVEAEDAAAEHPGDNGFEMINQGDVSYDAHDEEEERASEDDMYTWEADQEAHDETAKAHPAETIEEEEEASHEDLPVTTSDDVEDAALPENTATEAETVVDESDDSSTNEAQLLIGDEESSLNQTEEEEQETYYAEPIAEPSDEEYAIQESVANATADTHAEDEAGMTFNFDEALSTIPFADDDDTDVTGQAFVPEPPSDTSREDVSLPAVLEDENAPETKDVAEIEHAFDDTGSEISASETSAVSDTSTSSTAGHKRNKKLKKRKRKQQQQQRDQRFDEAADLTAVPENEEPIAAKVLEELEPAQSREEPEPLEEPTPADVLEPAVYDVRDDEAEEQEPADNQGHTTGEPVREVARTSPVKSGIAQLVRSPLQSSMSSPPPDVQRKALSGVIKPGLSFASAATLKRDTKDIKIPIHVGEATVEAPPVDDELPDFDQEPLADFEDDVPGDLLNQYPEETAFVDDSGTADENNYSEEPFTTADDATETALEVSATEDDSVAPAIDEVQEAVSPLEDSIEFVKLEPAVTFLPSLAVDQVELSADEESAPEHSVAAQEEDDLESSVVTQEGDSGSSADASPSTSQPASSANTPKKKTGSKKQHKGKGGKKKKGKR
ncbi:hypothetical protein RI367_003148 [Sorochytrium milnesiophthora]